jgi:hypothetical protein
LGNVISSRLVRGKNHSSLGGRKAYLTFELKDHDRRSGIMAQLPQAI